jgi:putative transcriptional regulator
MADDMRRGGLMDEETHQQITMRHLGEEERHGPPPLSPDEIRELREQAHMSQAVFALHLNMSPGQLSKLERGTERAAGPTLALLSAIKRNGIQVVL